MRHLEHVTTLSGRHHTHNLVEKAKCHLNLRRCEVLIPGSLDGLPELHDIFGLPLAHTALQDPPDDQIQHIEVRRVGWLPFLRILNLAAVLSKPSFSHALVWQGALSS